MFVAHSNGLNLTLYPQDQPCPAPSAARIFETFTRLPGPSRCPSRHLSAYLLPQFTHLRRQLLEMRPSSYSSHPEGGEVELGSELRKASPKAMSISKSS